MKALVLINAKSGTTAQAGEGFVYDCLAQGFNEAGWFADFEIGDCDALVAAARVRPGYDAIVAAGGDGTQAAVATALLGREIPLLPLPCGTMNVFCRDLGLPLDLPAALAAGLASKPRSIDVGRVRSEEFGERTFLNNIVFGAFADLAEARETLREIDTLDDVGFALVQAAAALAHAEPSRFRLAFDAERREFSTNTLVVSNNPFSGSSKFIPYRNKIDDGALALYLVEAHDGAGFTKRLVEFLTGAAADGAEKVELALCSECEITAMGEDPTPYAIDGDPHQAAGPVSMSIAPKALHVLAPQADAEKEDRRDAA
jgi:diacylglycerol kinase family enzyme